MNEVMRAVQAGRRVALVGGASAIVNLARAAIQLKQGGGTDHPELFAFNSWRDVQDYAHRDDGNDLRTFVRLVDEVGPDRIIAVADQLSDESNAEFTVSTCHRTKGRQWPKIRIARDFDRQVFDAGGNLRSLPREDAMLGYVAVTRAQNALDHASLSWINTYHRMTTSPSNDGRDTMAPAAFPTEAAA